MPLRTPPAAFLRRLHGYDPEMRCIWNDRSKRFEILVRSPGASRRSAFVRIMRVESPAGSPREIGSGEWIIEELRRGDVRRRTRHGTPDEMFEAAIGGPRRRKQDASKRKLLTEKDHLVREGVDVFAQRQYSVDGVQPGANRGTS